MQRPLIYVAAVCSPLVAALIYALRFGSCANAYYLSILLGVSAFTWACNQLVLAARPHFLAASLGKRGMRRLHTLMSTLILAAATLHGLLKVGLLFAPGTAARPADLVGSIVHSLLWGQGFRRSGLAAVLGQAGWLALVAGLLATTLFLAPGFFLKLGLLRRIRGHLFERGGASYRRFRRLHRVWAVLVLFFLLHALSASSTGILSNPVAAIWLLVYFTASLAVFLVSYFRRLGTHPVDHLRAAHERLRASRAG